MAVCIVPNNSYSMNFLNSGLAVTQPFAGITLGTTLVGTLYVEFKVKDYSDKTIFCIDRETSFHRGWGIEIFNRKISGNWYNGTDQRASISVPIQLNKIYRVVFSRESGGFNLYHNFGGFVQGSIPADTDTTLIDRFVFGGRRPSAPEKLGNCEIFSAAYYSSSSKNITNKLLTGSFKDATYWWTGAQPNGKLSIASVTQKRIQYNNINL